MSKIVLIGLLCLIVNIGFSQEQNSIKQEQDSIKQEQDSIKQYNLNEVVISVTRSNTRLKNIPQKAEVIGQAQLRELPATNMADVLKNATNLDIIQYPGLSSSIGMRGFSPSAHSRSHTLILIDGKPMGTTNISTLDKDIVKRVEIIKGPYSTFYGSDAMGGVINIITKSPSKNNTGNTEVSFGSFDNLRLSGNINGVLSKKSSFLIGFIRNQQRNDYKIGSHNLLKIPEKDKLILDKASYGDVIKNSTWQYNQAYGQYNYNINEKWTSNTQIIYFNANDVKLPGSYWGSFGQSKKDIDRINLYETLTRKSKKNNFYFSPYYTKELNKNYNNNSDTSFVSFKSNLRQYGFKMNDNILFGNFKLLTGTDLDIYNYQSDRFKGKAIPTNPYSPNYQNTTLAIFSQLSYSKGGFAANAGVRYNYINYHVDKNELLKGTGGSRHYNVFNPSAGAQYTFPFHLKLHSSYGTGFSVPDAFKVAGFYAISEYFAAWNFWWTKNYLGNPDLKPESSSTVDFGATYSTSNKLLLFDATYFITKDKNKIIESALDSAMVNNKMVYNVTSYKNADNSTKNGIELMASINIGALYNNKFKLEFYGKLTHMFNNTVDETLRSSTGNDSIVKRDLLYVRKSNAIFGINYDNYKGFSTRLNARYIGPRLERDYFSGLRPGLTVGDYYTGGGYTAKDKILKFPKHLVFDYYVSYTIKNYRFGINISNLFDENYTEKDGYNMPGRTIMANFNFKF